MTNFNVKALATEKNKLFCRSFCEDPKWHVYLAETTWADGTARVVAIFECLSCSQLRYVDTDFHTEVTEKLTDEERKTLLEKWDLRLEVAELKRRIQGAEAALRSDAPAHVRCADALGVLSPRKPLPKARKGRR